MISKPVLGTNKKKIKISVSQITSYYKCKSITISDVYVEQYK